MAPNSPSSSAITPAPLAGKELTREQAEAALRWLAGDLDPATHPPFLFSSPPRNSAERSADDDRREVPPAVEPLVLESATFRIFLEAVPDAVVIVNRAGRIVRVNKHARQLFGYEDDELLGQPIEQDQRRRAAVGARPAPIQQDAQGFRHDVLYLHKHGLASRLTLLTLAPNGAGCVKTASRSDDIFNEVA